jgi:hypothetical protein
VLHDNVPMLEILRHAGGGLDIEEPGVLRSVVDVPTASTGLERSGLASRLRTAVTCASAGFPEDPDQAAVAG